MGRDEKRVWEFLSRLPKGYLIGVTRELSDHYDVIDDKEVKESDKEDEVNQIRRQQQHQRREGGPAADVVHLMRRIFGSPFFP